MKYTKNYHLGLTHFLDAISFQLTHHCDFIFFINCTHSPLYLQFLCVPLEIVILDIRLIYKKSSITTTVITIARKMMIMTTLEAMAAVFVDACAEDNKVSGPNSD